MLHKLFVFFWLDGVDVNVVDVADLPDDFFDSVVVVGFFRNRVSLQVHFD